MTIEILFGLLTALSGGVLAFLLNDRKMIVDQNKALQKRVSFLERSLEKALFAIIDIADGEKSTSEAIRIAKGILKVIDDKKKGDEDFQTKDEMLDKI